MNSKQREVLQFFLNFKTAREDQVIRLTKCNKSDIEFLLTNKYIEKNKEPEVYYHKLRGLDVKFVVALDVICRCEKIISNFNKGKFPVIVTFEAENTTFDVIVAKAIEQSRIFRELDKISFSDKIIIIVENKEKCDITEINTDRETLISTYPLSVIAKVN